MNLVSFFKFFFGGESGIRTHGTCEGTHTFQACALNHSATSPISDQIYNKLISIENFKLNFDLYKSNFFNISFHHNCPCQFN